MSKGRTSLLDSWDGVTAETFWSFLISHSSCLAHLWAAWLFFRPGSRLVFGGLSGHTYPRPHLSEIFWSFLVCLVCPTQSSQPWMLWKVWEDLVYIVSVSLAVGWPELTGAFGGKSLFTSWQAGSKETQKKALGHQYHLSQYTLLIQLLSPCPFPKVP